MSFFDKNLFFTVVWLVVVGGVAMFVMGSGFQWQHGVVLALAGLGCRAVSLVSSTASSGNVALSLIHI